MQANVYCYRCFRFLRLQVEIVRSIVKKEGVPRAGQKGLGTGDVARGILGVWHAYAFEIRSLLQSTQIGKATDSVFLRRLIPKIMWYRKGIRRLIALE